MRPLIVEQSRRGEFRRTGRGAVGNQGQGKIGHGGLGIGLELLFAVLTTFQGNNRSAAEEQVGELDSVGRQPHGVAAQIENDFFGALGPQRPDRVGHLRHALGVDHVKVDVTDAGFDHLAGRARHLHLGARQRVLLGLFGVAQRTNQHLDGRSRRAAQQGVQIRGGHDARVEIIYGFDQVAPAGCRLFAPRNQARPPARTCIRPACESPARSPTLFPDRGSCGFSRTARTARR